MYPNHTTNEIPYGYCQCGCGQKTKIAAKTRKEAGWIKGQPIRYIDTHFKLPTKYNTLAEHFWTYCTQGMPNECWDWQGSLAVVGYGHFRRGGKTHHAHRVSWEIHNGPIPKGLHVLHKCDRPCCNNPAHLFLGTQTDNMADMHQKKRHAYGERQGASKLSADSVREIRRLHIIGKTATEIAKQFNVAPGTIRPILKGKTWTHVK